MRYNTFIGESIRSLEASKLTPTDTALSFLIMLQKIHEEIVDAFGYNTSSGIKLSLGMESLLILVRAFQSRLVDLRLSFPADPACYRKWDYVISLKNTLS